MTSSPRRSPRSRGGGGCYLFLYLFLCLYLYRVFSVYLKTVRFLWVFLGYFRFYLLFSDAHLLNRFPH